MKRSFLWLAAALLMSGQASSQDAKLTIDSAHGKVIHEYVVTERVQPATVTIPIEIGATIPEGINLDPVPLAMVEKVPEVRNYEYFVSGGKVVFVEPYTRKILQIVQ